ncbi:MAG: response regulator transcription factor [Flavobacteriales bacterium]|nr:response regulator transcription factor [Flavobacteriales bacterium]
MSEKSKISVFIVDDHEMVVNGLRSMLEDEEGIEVVGQASTAEETLNALEHVDVDVVLMDIHLPKTDGIELCCLVTKAYQKLSVLAISSFSEVIFVKQMIQNGAKGYLLKNTSTDELIEAINAVYNGEEFFSSSIKENLVSASLGRKTDSFIPKITKREKEVLKLITDEFTTKEISEKLFISVATVETHRLHLLHKLNAKNTAGLVKIAIQKGIIK